MRSPFAKLFVTIGLGLALASSAYAYRHTSEQDCTSVDFRDNFNLKNRNQGNISWCYAHTAADYLQYFYGLGTQISAADIAIQYNLRLWPKVMQVFTGRAVPQTGFIRPALMDAVESGYCPESVFPSERWTKHYLSGERAGKTEDLELGDATQVLFQMQTWIKLGIYRAGSELPFVFDFPFLTKEVFIDVLQNSTRANLLNHLRLAACDGRRIQFPAKISRMIMRLNGPRSFKVINRQLDRSMPVSIDYFYGVLENQDVFKTSLSELHTSLLYGRRFSQDSNECQYLVKNSYGRYCNGQHYDPRNDCQGGFLWVSERALYGALMSYEYIDDDLPALRSTSASENVLLNSDGSDDLSDSDDAQS